LDAIVARTGGRGLHESAGAALDGFTLAKHRCQDAMAANGWMRALSKMAKRISGLLVIMVPRAILAAGLAAAGPEAMGISARVAGDPLLVDHLGGVAVAIEVIGSGAVGIRHRRRDAQAIAHGNAQGFGGDLCHAAKQGIGLQIMVQGQHDSLVIGLAIGLVDIHRDRGTGWDRVVAEQYDLLTHRANTVEGADETLAQFVHLPGELTAGSPDCFRIKWPIRLLLVFLGTAVCFSLLVHREVDVV